MNLKISDIGMPKIFSGGEDQVNATRVVCRLFFPIFYCIQASIWFELKNCGSYAVVYISPEFLREALFSKKSKVLTI
jgi:hypothetical protein